MLKSLWKYKERIKIAGSYNLYYKPMNQRERDFVAKLIYTV